MILERQYILEQDLDTCERLLKKALKNPDIDKSLIKYPHLHAQADELANTIALLEDRVAYLIQVQNVERANAIRWGRIVEEPQTPPPDEGFDD